MRLSWRGGRWRLKSGGREASIQIRSDSRRIGRSRNQSTSSARTRPAWRVRRAWQATDGAVRYSECVVAELDLDLDLGWEFAGPRVRTFWTSQGALLDFHSTTTERRPCWKPPTLPCHYITAATAVAHLLSSSIPSTRQHSLPSLAVGFVLCMHGHMHPDSVFRP